MSAPRFNDEAFRPDTAPSMPPVVAVVDNDPWLRRALVQSLVVAGFEAETHRSVDSFLLSLTRNLRPRRCLILELRKAGASGLDLPTELRRRGIDLSIISLSRQAEIPAVVSAVRSGAMRNLQQPLSTRALIDKLSDVLSRSARRNSARKRDSSQPPGIEWLTRRERVVLSQLLAVRSTHEISNSMRISFQSVASHKRELMKKFNVRSELELVLRLTGLMAEAR